MTEEIKTPAPPPPAGEEKPAAEKAVPPAQAAPPSTPAKAAPPAAPTAAKTPSAAGAATAAPPKPAAHAKPAGPVPVPWSSPLVEKYKRQYGSGLDAQTYLGQNYFSVDRSLIPNILTLLRDEEQFDYCVDVTAVHYPKRDKQFDVIWILYSFARNERVRVKTQIADGESLPSVVPIWATANWLEREVFDMFGIKFDGHPDLKRILLPEGWKGFPLRKDYGILQQDQEWVHINLGIESGQ
ncbi:MAG TPA: NADH-quinone oxidoreductase subunit C [Terriglobales bacterium]|nr:NADH-quinone oxidoreductase subunit C [Terriglobales bacterium]